MSSSDLGNASAIATSLRLTASNLLAPKSLMARSLFDHILDAAKDGDAARCAELVGPEGAVGLLACGRAEVLRRHGGGGTS